VIHVPTVKAPLSPVDFHFTIILGFFISLTRVFRLLRVTVYHQTSGT